MEMEMTISLDDLKPKRIDFDLDSLPDLFVVKFQGQEIATSRREIMAMLDWLIDAYQKGELQR